MKTNLKQGLKPLKGSANPLALGCWAFGGMNPEQQTDKDSLATMAAALEAGINHFDTASSYGNGKSEELVGSFICGHRDRIFLASKHAVQESKERYLDKIGSSLKRLKTDYIDLYYIHWPRTGVDLRPSMEALSEARDKGWIRAIGVSNFSTEQMQKALEVTNIDAHQLCYNLIWRTAELEIIPFCREKGIKIISYSSIAQGILTGKFALDHGLGPDDIRSGTVFFRPEIWPLVHNGVERLKEYSKNWDKTMLELAVAWVLSRKDISAVLIGSRTPAQLLQNRKAADTRLEDEQTALLTGLSDRIIRDIPDTGNIFQYYP